jgi:hypothetical protein
MGAVMLAKPEGQTPLIGHGISPGQASLCGVHLMTPALVLNLACGASVSTSLNAGCPGAGQICGQFAVPVPAAIATSTSTGLLQDSRAVKFRADHDSAVDSKIHRKTSP